MALQHQQVTKTTEPKQTPQPAPSLALQPQAQEHPLLQLQQDIGNQAVLQLMRAGLLQAKLEVNQPDDPFERQANAVADRVMRAPLSEETEGECVSCANKRRGVQRAGAGTPRVLPSTAAIILNPGPGRSLSSSVRRRLESNLGANLSQVRVHESPAATRAAASLQARAFTHGRDIFLGPGASGNDVRLMAHEVTHVVQQGAAPLQRSSANGKIQRTEAQPQIQPASASKPPAIQRGIGDRITGVAGAAWDATGGRLVDAAGNLIEMGANFFWDILGRLAPSFVPILRRISQRGIIGYLTDMISGAFNRIFSGLGVNPAMLSGLMATFNGLVTSVQEILAALARGDCQPLFNAVNRLSEIVQQIAGEAWDAIKEFFRPVGDFFKKLWERFGAPALDWLGEVAGEAWEGIKNLGKRIWGWTKPVRDAIAAAWTTAWGWIKEQLGIGGGDDSEGGLLGWVQDKLGEAWGWIKEKLEPVIGPIRALVDRIRAILPLDAILNLRETVRGWLSNVRGMVQNMRQPQDTVQNQDALRNEILPAVKASIVRLRGRIVGAGQWVADKVGGLVATAAGFFGSLRNNSILGAFAGAINWVEEKVASLGEWAQNKVTNLFGFIGDGLVRLSRFIEPVLNTLQKVVSVIGDVMGELPGLVLGPFWRMIPVCIREPIKNFIIEHILRNIPIINKFLDIPDIWSRIQNLVMNFLRQVFVNGDLGGAVMTVIRFVLEAAGVDVDLFLRIIGNAAGALETIIMDPVGFLRNLFGALRQGFNQFLSNIGRHLINGLLAWLLGPLEDLGITPPRDLSLKSILELVLAILGISAARLRQKAERLIGPRAVALLTEAWRWISALISGGLGGLWEEIKSRLSDLWSTIIGGISQWITVQIVGVAIEKLVTMSNPVGAVLQAIISIYRTVSFFVERINQILALVNAVVDSISQIASGSISAAANFIENAMARTIPIILGFLANLVGIGNPAPTIRRIVVGIQAKVDRALDWLVDKAISIGRRLLGALGVGGRPAPGADLPPAQVQKTFALSGAGHTLSASTQRGGLEITMASSQAGRLQQMLQNAIREVEDDASRPSGLKAQLLSILRRALEDSKEESIHQDWISRGARDPALGAVEFPRFLEARLARIVNDLSALSPFGIKSLDELHAQIPERRYLPHGYDVRQNLYERGSGWSSVRDSVVREEKPDIRTRVRVAIQNKDSDRRRADEVWRQLIREDKIPSSANIATFTSDDVERTEYQVDHIRPLSLNWQVDGGNNSDDGFRWAAVIERSNLRLITREANRRKSGEGGRYVPFVGPNFTSQSAQGAVRGARAIDGQPFLDAAGNPIV